jgi:hypothetical protein
MRCKAHDAPQCEHCKRWATLQSARYGQQNCATYFCAVPYPRQRTAFFWNRGGGVLAQA